MENFFENKVAVVTGAGGTLCSEIAKFLGSRGAKVALIGRTEAKLQPVAEAICAMGGTALVIAAVILFNVVFSMLASKYLWYIDMTREGLYTVSGGRGLGGHNAIVKAVLFRLVKSTLTALFVSSSIDGCPSTE